MPKNHKSWIIVIFSLLIVNLAATGFIVIHLFTQDKDMAETGRIPFTYAENGQYVLYIGLNDKDAYEQLIPTDEARKIISDICVNYTEGYTVSEAHGGWVDENGVFTRENTLVYTFTGAEESAIISIMDEVFAALNQNTVLVERRSISSAFYSGED